MLLVAHHELGDAGELRLLHRLHEQGVHLLGALVGPDVVRLREEDRVDLVVRDEVDDVDRLVALYLGGLEVLLVHEDVFALLELERLDDLVVGDGLVLLLADLLVADRAVVLLVHEVELELVLLHRAVKPHGHVDEAERDRARPK